jgi:hypothetical protein
MAPGRRDDFPLAQAWAHARTLRIVDVRRRHLDTLAGLELARAEKVKS